MRMAVDIPAPRSAALAAALALALVAAPARPAALDEVERLFRAGEYARARALNPAAVSSGQPGEGALWALQLAERPSRALELARELAAGDDLPAPVRVRAALDGAAVAHAQGRPDAALEILEPLLEDHHLAPLPGEVALRAGLAARAVRLLPEARRFLERVPAGDPAFAPAAYHLGRVALDLGEAERALQAFAAAAAAGGDDPLVAAGRWQALRRLGRAAEAQATAVRVLREHPTSLAALEIRAEQRRAGEAAPPALPPDVPAAARRDEPPAAELTVELARFADRAEALVFLARWRGRLADLDLVDLPGAAAVTAGRFATREEADAAADSLRAAWDLRGRVVERRGR